MGGVEARFAVGRVGGYGHIHRLVEGREPGRAGGVGGTEHHVFGKIRVGHHPFDSLESAERHADHFVHFLDSKPFGKEAVAFHGVADCDAREIATPGFAGGGVDGAGSGGAVARPEHVGADDEIFFGIEKLILFNRVGPPVGHIGIGCKTVHYPYHVAAVFIEGAVGVVCYGDRREGDSAFKSKGFVDSAILRHDDRWMCLLMQN